LPDQAYRPEVSDQVYAAMRQEAGRALQVGFAVVVDAVFDRPQERERIEQLAAGRGVPFTGYWLQAPMALLVSRVAARRNDPSDATAAVVHRQAARNCGKIDWTRLDASREPLITKDAILHHPSFSTGAS